MFKASRSKVDLGLDHRLSVASHGVIEIAFICAEESVLSEALA